MYEQWLYSDLKESGEGFLPSNLHGVQAQFVRGDFCLQVSSSSLMVPTHHHIWCTPTSLVVQVNSVLNVAASLYSQLQKVRGQELDEAEDTSFVARQNKVVVVVVVAVVGGGGGVAGVVVVVVVVVVGGGGGGGVTLLSMCL